MGRVMRRQANVRFFEVLNEHTERLEDFDWPSAMRAVWAAPFKERTVETRAGEEVFGTAFNAEAQVPHLLLLSEPRDGEVPEIVDWTSGDVEDLEIAEGRGLVETARAMFFEGNIVGFVRSNTAPGPSKLEAWLNGVELFENQPTFIVRPLPRVTVEKKIADIEQARSLSFRMQTSAHTQLQESAPGIANVTRALSESFGPVKVEVKISVTQDKGYDEESAKLLKEGLALAEERPAGIEDIKVSYKSMERQRAAVVDLIQEHFAEPVPIEVVDDEGRTVRNVSVAKGMKYVYDANRTDLMNAADRPRG